MKLYTSEFNLKNKTWNRSVENISYNIEEKDSDFAVLDILDSKRTDETFVYAESIISQKEADKLVIEYIDDLFELLRTARHELYS